MKPAILLVDGNNVSGTLAEGERVSWETVFVYLKKQGYELLEAHYFLATRSVMPEDAYDRHRAYVAMLVEKGFRLHEKQMRRSRSRNKWKGDCDIEIALEAARIINTPLYDNHPTILIMSNDSDFTAVAEYAQFYGRSLGIISLDGHPGLELRNAADVYLDLSKEEGVTFTKP